MLVRDDMRRSDRTESPLAGALDMHVHVIGPSKQFPLWPGRSYEPPLAEPHALFAHMARTGVDAAVLVQPSVYGADNSRLISVLRIGKPNLFGIVVPDPGTDDRTLDAWDRLGVRGIRLNLVNPAVLSPRDAIRLAARTHRLGWHLQVQLDLNQCDGVALIQDLAHSVAAPIVIDHLGLCSSPEVFQTIMPLLQRGKIWLKVSAPYRLAPRQPPLAALLKLLFAACPDQLIWGSDWPHTDTTMVRPDPVRFAAWLHELAAGAHAPKLFRLNASRLLGLNPCSPPRPGDLRNQEGNMEICITRRA